MPEHIQYEDDDLFNRDTHHEASDVPIRPLFVFIAIFVLFAFFTHFLIFFMYKGLRKAETSRAEAPFTEVARPQSEKVPQQPLLQPFPREDRAGEVMPPHTNTPVTDLVDMRRAEDQVLRNYGWVDQEKGIVRMPLEAAKALAVQRLNAAPSVAAPASGAGTMSATTTTATTAEAAAPTQTTTTGGQR